MDFIRREARGPDPFAYDYRLVEGAGRHPEGIAELDDDQQYDLLEAAHVRETMAQFHRENPTQPALGTGTELLVGYDCEWWERFEGVLVCLSYQLYIIGVGGEMAVVCYPRSDQVEGRLTFNEIMAEAVALARETGIIIEYPKELVLTGFFLRSDLAMLADLPAFKRQLSNIGGKVATAGAPIEFEIRYRARDVANMMSGKAVSLHEGDAGAVLPTRFIDVAKHADERAPLSALGELIGLPKMELPEGYRKDRMDLLMQGNLDFFREYGVVDAEIVILYWLRILAFAKQVIGVDDVPVSAGALAVQFCRKTFEEAKLDYEELFAVAPVKRTERDIISGRVLTRRRYEVDGMRQFHETFAIACFHGGRNETFTVGPTRPDHWIDVDLVGAYTTGLVVFRPIDYDNSHETKELSEFLGDVLGLAWVDFEYPPETRFPALPVRSEEHGLIFPLRGRSYCSAAEIGLAIRQGCAIRIKRGVVWPWRENVGDVRVFESFVRKIRQLRKEFEGQPVLEKYAKVLGNSLYGKTAQSLREKTAFDMEFMGSRKIPPSLVTNAPIAAYVTGLIRAVVGELLHAIPAHRDVLSSTTDGLLTNALPEEVDLSGELCQRYLSLCERVEAKNPKMIKVKHEAIQLLSMRTRAQATLMIDTDTEKKLGVLLAKGSISPPENTPDRNQYMVDLYFGRVPRQKTRTRPFVSLRDQMIHERDVVRLERVTTMNLEYDMKRRPVRARMENYPGGSHVAFDTLPWPTFEEAELARALFDEWRKDHCIKTLQDFEDWEDYYLTRRAYRLMSKGGKAPMQITATGSVGILVRIFLRAYVSESWGLRCAMTQREVAEVLTRLGCPTHVNDVKNGNKGKLIERIVPRTPRAEAFWVDLAGAFEGLDAGLFFMAD